MQWLESTGIFGFLILGLALLLLVGLLVCAVVRIPRVAAACLLLASFLPLLTGVFGMYVGLAQMQEVLASLADATPGDAAVGQYESERILILGLATTLLCYAAALVAFARSRESVARAAA